MKQKPLQENVEERQWCQQTRDKSISQIAFWFQSVFCKGLLILIFLSSAVNAADVNVLIVGTTQDRGGTSNAFDISMVRAELENILTGAGMGTVQVSLHDLPAYKRGNKLIEGFLDLDFNSQWVPADFWAKLRGQSGTDWDYVILMGEPHTIEYFPGSAKVILQWY